MEKKPKALSPAKATIFQRRRSFRDIQGVISKMDPEVVKSVIENGSNKSCFSVPSTPNGTQAYLFPMPRHHPKLSEGENKAENTSPMTIFYNGKVLVYHVSPHQAQGILNVAKEIFPKSDSDENLLESLNGDFPIFRRHSLQRFLEKRKERLTGGPLKQEK